MAIQKINLGTEPHGVGGDSYRTANEKINSNFEEVDRGINIVSDGNSETLSKLLDEVLRAKLAESDLSANITKEVNDRKTEVSRLDVADALLQSQINSVGGGKFAYKTYAEMVADKSNITPKSSVDVLADTDDKNGTYLYDGDNFVKSQYDLERIITSKVQNTFDTYALMIASNLSDGAYALVADDTEDNNGMYVKTAGAWVKSDYDPLTQSKTYTDDRFAKNTNASKELEIAIDSDGLVYREVDENGMMTIAGMDKSVQSAISELSNIYLTPTGDGDIEQVWDNSGNLVRRTNSSGSMYISTGRGSIQHHLRQPISEQVDKFAFNYPVKLNRDEYKPIVREAVAKLQQECLPYIEPPPLLVHNNYDLPDSILSVITISDDNPVAHLDFPYGKGGTVHPFALPLRKPLYGYKNILADSFHKYGSETEETPIMFGTNDWVNFELLEDVAQPFWRNKMGTTGLTRSNGFLSDPWIAYDPTDGALIRGTRETSREAADGDPAGTNYKVTKSYDGVRWTPIETFVLPDVSDGKSPSMLYDMATQTWHLWVVSLGSHIAHYTSPNWNKNWVKVSETPFSTLHGIEPWHMEVKYVGDRFALVCSSLREGSTVNFGFSSDGDTWVMSDNLLNPTSDWIYKPTFTVEFKDEDTVRIVFMWGHWDWITRLHDASMPLHVQPTEWIKISELP